MPRTKRPRAVSRPRVEGSHAMPRRRVLDEDVVHDSPPEAAMSPSMKMMFTTRRRRRRCRRVSTKSRCRCCSKREARRAHHAGHSTRMRTHARVVSVSGGGRVQRDAGRDNSHHFALHAGPAGGSHPDSADALPCRVAGSRRRRRRRRWRRRSRGSGRPPWRSTTVVPIHLHILTFGDCAALPTRAR